MPEVVKINDEAFFIEGLLSPSECKLLIQEAEALGFQESKIISGGKEIVAKEIRNNDRVILDSFEIANMLWGKSEDFIPAELDGCAVLGLNERMRFYRYEPKQSFRGHRDFPYQRKGEKSKLSLIVYLNEEYDGGETKFRDFSVTPKTGLGLVFRHELLHEGCVVKAGIKYAMRTDVMYESNT